MTVGAGSTPLVLIVSVLFNEPKLLKCYGYFQSAEPRVRFSALQRAEIAEMQTPGASVNPALLVSVLFNEPKLLKLRDVGMGRGVADSFSALQRAEIAEIEFEGEELGSVS